MGYYSLVPEKLQKVDPEVKFRALESECIECIREIWLPGNEKTGVCVDIEANNDRDLYLTLGNDGSWEVVKDLESYEIGKNPLLRTLLTVFALMDEDDDYEKLVEILVTDPGHRFETVDLYLEKHGKRLTDELFWSMQNLLDESYEEKRLPEKSS